MEFQEIVRAIRKRTGDSQQAMAAALNVSYATVNRWERGHCEPTPLALDGLRRYCAARGMDYSEFEGNTIAVGSGSVVLYHGSKSGLDGPIRPCSRDLCDFGRGFYMGTERLQPLTLICNFPGAKLYIVKADLTGLRVLDVAVGVDWALLIAYHRGKMESARGSALYEKYAAMARGCDMIVGFIANDRMFVVLDRFFSGEITDVALIHSLSSLQLGKQYVALTDKACGQIAVLEEMAVGPEERARLRASSEVLRGEGVRQAEEICRRHRREGRFFDEILEGGA